MLKISAHLCVFLQVSFYTLGCICCGLSRSNVASLEMVCLFVQCKVTTAQAKVRLGYQCKLSCVTHQSHAHSCSCTVRIAATHHKKLAHETEMAKRPSLHQTTQQPSQGWRPSLHQTMQQPPQGWCPADIRAQCGLKGDHINCTLLLSTC